MNKARDAVLADLKERLNYLINDAEYYHRHWKEKELKIAQYKNTIAEMENMDGNHQFKSRIVEIAERRAQEAPQSSL